MPFFVHILFFFIQILLVTGCTFKSPPADILLAARDTTITLKNSLGDFNVTIPDRYDTLFTWRQNSCCSNCGTQRYRFQNKSLPVFKESGFYWEPSYDSIDQLTIIHSQFTQINDSTGSNFIKGFHENFLNTAQVEFWAPNNAIEFDSVFQINKNWFSIYTSEYFDTMSKIYFKGVAGSLVVRGNRVTVLYCLKTRNNDIINGQFIEDGKIMVMKILTENG